MRFGCWKELSHFEYPQLMFWLRNEKNNFQLHTLILGPENCNFNLPITHWDGSFEYPQHMFGWEIKKSFTILLSEELSNFDVT